jgi:peroxiredoxin
MKATLPSKAMKKTLVAAGLYNLLWGSLAVFAPSFIHSAVGLSQPGSPLLWQYAGTMVGAYGIAYFVASSDPYHHWPIVLAGLAGKVLVPIGFVIAFLRGQAPVRFGAATFFSEVVWWIPFVLILRGAYRKWEAEDLPITDPRAIAQVLAGVRTQYSRSLAQLSEQAPVLAVFLRHAGCTFCREALSDIARARHSIESAGVTIVLVTMSPEEEAASQFGKYGLGDVDRISDAGRNLYRVFGLRRGGYSQLLGAKVLRRGFDAGILHGHGVGVLEGDGFQMPGVFLLRDGEVVRSFRHRTAADRPDYEALAGVQRRVAAGSR